MYGKLVNKKIFQFLFAFYLLFYPFLLFNIPALKYVIKYPFIILTFFLLIPYNFSKLRFKFHYIYLPILILIVAYINYDLSGSIEYIALGGITILFSSIFSREGYLKIFIDLYTFLGCLISLHALLQMFFVISGLIKLVSFPEMIGIGTVHAFNPFLGVIDSQDFSQLRIASFFTESNRLGYFLVPLIFIHTSLKSKYSKLYLTLFGLVLLLTKSFAALGVFIVLRIIFYKNLRFFYISILILFLYIILIQLNECSLSFYCETDILTQIDRGKSISNRLASFYHLTTTLPSNPFGISSEILEEVAGVAPIYSALVFWSLVGGWIALLSLIFLSLSVIYKSVNFIYSYQDSPYKGLFIGIIGYTVFELFMGSGFSGLFNIFISIILTLPTTNRLYEQTYK